METQDLLTRTHSAGTSPSWKIRKGVKATPGLTFAAKVFTWIETYVQIREKSGKIRTIELNTVQQIMAQYVASCWHAKVPVRVVLVKSRQQGSSTFWDALFVAMAELKPGYQSAIIAHDEAGAEVLFNKVDTALRRLEKTGWPAPALINDQGMLRRWETESAIGSGTIKTGDALGKGATPNALHLSEGANYSDKGVNAMQAVNSIKQGMVEDEWTIEVHESTAKGKDPWFFPLCEDAANPDSDSAYHLIFLPWFLTPEYKMTWEDYRRELTHAGKKDPGPKFVPTQDEQGLRARLASEKPKAHEKHFRYTIALSDEQLIWRRWALATRCKGDLNDLLRYYPSFYEECFTASTVCYFDSDTIHYYRNLARDPIARGTLSRAGSPEKPRFVPDEMGYLHIWEMPKPHVQYVIGADPGGERVDRDPSCAYVVNKFTHECVAQIYGNLAAGDLTTALAETGYFYNGAFLVVESNFNPTVANDLHRLNYPNLYYYYKDAQIEAHVGRSPGFNTNLKTRPEILSNLKELLKDRVPHIPDGGFWKEMETFIFVPKAASLNPEREGKYQAVGKNHDDRIMAAALAYFFTPPPGPAPTQDPEPEGPNRAWLFYQSIKPTDGPSGVML